MQRYIKWGGTTINTVDEKLDTEIYSMFGLMVIQTKAKSLFENLKAKKYPMSWINIDIWC